MFSEHPSKDIKGGVGSILEGKNICLCVTGSVAIIQSVYVVRELMRLGAEVYVVMTSAAQKLVHPSLFEWASGNPVTYELTGKIEHVSLAGKVENNCDVVLICPATANTISKIAAGIDDTPVTTVVTTAFGSEIPIVIVPAMHSSMYHHPILKENIKKLKRFGVKFFGPRFEENKAKIAHVNEIVNQVVAILKARIKDDLRGLKILIAGGPTREYLDGVRYITNPSSGKMGVALAREALLRGAEKITFIYGRGTATPPTYENVKIINITSAKELVATVEKELTSEKYDAFICAAAIADYMPASTEEHKIPSRQKELNVKLIPTPRCIENARELDKELFICAFKAEYDVSEEQLIEKAYKRISGPNAKANLIVANDVGKSKRGFQHETNEVFIIDTEKNIKHIPLEMKDEIANEILDQIARKLKQRAKNDIWE
ncbi:MAG: bifunctional phosphopantothenoylcysteine decarboxylase/phosphopantothenate--cysteine ligase CoaBC [Candidatus Helarchaeota archaeon]